MSKIEISLDVEHADLYRDADNNLVAHLVGVDEDDLIKAMAKFQADRLAATQALSVGPVAGNVTE